MTCPQAVPPLPILLVCTIFKYLLKHPEINNVHCTKRRSLLYKFSGVKAKTCKYFWPYKMFCRWCICNVSHALHASDAQFFFSLLFLSIYICCHGTMFQSCKNNYINLSVKLTYIILCLYITYNSNRWRKHCTLLV